MAHRTRSSWRSPQAPTLWATSHRDWGEWRGGVRSRPSSLLALAVAGLVVVWLYWWPQIREAQHQLDLAQRPLEGINARPRP